MHSNLPQIDKSFPLLNIVKVPKNTFSDYVQMDLDEERKHLEAQAAAEEFWAGRNLAARNSTRKAA